MTTLAKYGHLHDPKLFNFFHNYKNPKIGFFYLYLLNNFRHKRFRLKKINLAYEFDVCEKTIKNWLQELMRLGFLCFNAKPKHLVCIQIKNYRQTQAFKDFVLGRSNLPNRFFKEIALILKHIQQRNLERVVKDKFLNFYSLIQSTKNRMQSLQRVIVEFVSEDNPQENRSLTYEQLTQRGLPSIKCAYHRAIIKKRILQALEDYFRFARSLE